MARPQLTDADVRRVREYWRGSVEFIGLPDAEKDSQRDGWYDSLFVASESHSRIVAGTSSIVIGRKGSGKSAARLATHFPSSTDRVPRLLTLDISADAVFADYLEHFQKLAANATGAVRTWQQAYSFQALRLLAENLSGKALSNSAEVRLRRWAVEHGHVAPDLGERFTAAAKKYVPQVRSVIAPDGTATAVTEAEVAKLLTERPVHLFVDDLDTVYDSGRPRESIAMVRAALEAADRFRTATGPRVTILIRDDLWRLARAGWHYADKVSGATELRWDDDGLRRLIERRLRQAVAVALGSKDFYAKFEELWRIFFPDTIELDDRTVSAGPTYIVRRTLYTPRDVLTFLTKIGERCAHWPATQTQVVEGEERFSLDRMDFLITEFGTLCSGLASVLHSFSAQRLEWIPSIMYKHLDALLNTGEVRLAEAVRGNGDAVDLARFLYLIGFIEVRYPDATSNTPRYEVRDVLRQPEQWQGIRRDDSIRLAVRSTFYRALKSHAR